MTAEGILRSNEDPQRPKAYLNYILFDEQMEIVSTFTGSFQANGNGAWQEIGTTAPMEIPANGYLAVYLSNQSRPTGCHVCGDVFFDKVKVRFSQGKLKEETHYFGFAQYKYYPFGLPMGNAGSTASNFLPNRRKCQSNEYIKDLNLNWMDFNFRQYDPQLGRFLSVDPLAASGGQDRISPYAAMGNQPEFAVDPEGLLPNVFTKAGGGSVPEEGGPASSGWNMFGKGADMWYSSYMEFGGSGGGGSDGGASAASENAIPNTSSTSIYTMIGIAKSSPKGTANFNNENDGSEDKKYDIEGNINATNLPEKSSMEGIPVDQTAFGRGVNEFFIDISPGLGAVNMIKKYATGKSLLGNESSGMSPFEAIVPIIGRS